MKEPLNVVIGTEIAPSSLHTLRDRFSQVEFTAALTPQQLTERIREADILFGGRVEAEMIARAARLRWVQSFSAGINHLPLDQLAAQGIVLTTASGAHGIPIAENLLSMMLAFAVRLHEFDAAKGSARWIANISGNTKFELEGQTLLVIGLGGIGATLARKASALGLRVLGIRRRAIDAPVGVDRLLSPAQLFDGLALADHVALCLPLTPDTDGYIGVNELRAMKPTAHIYNVGRGGSIERGALLRALREGWIAGAGLDVTDPEPLPSDDPLWSLDNVILTQHTSGWSPKVEQRVVTIFSDNLHRYIAGTPLVNQVDWATKY